jgi:hypothetical protein
MRFDMETQDLTAGGAQQTALPERVPEAVAPRLGRRVVMGEVIKTPDSRVPG